MALLVVSILINLNLKYCTTVFLFVTVVVFHNCIAYCDFFLRKRVLIALWLIRLVGSFCHGVDIAQIK